MSLDNNFSIDPPDPVYVSIATGLLRTCLAAAAGVGFGWAAGVSGDQVAMMATALVVVVTACWSAWQKVKAHRALDAAADASVVRPAATIPDHLKGI